MGARHPWLPDWEPMDWVIVIAMLALFIYLAISPDPNDGSHDPAPGSYDPGVELCYDGLGGTPYPC